MKTYIISNHEIVVNENGLVTFARNLTTGKFIKHKFAKDLILSLTDNDIMLDFIFYSIIAVVCLTMVIFLAHLSVIENSILLVMLVALRMLNVANVKVNHLSNKQRSI